MPITDTYARIPLSSIHVDRTSRQRREVYNAKGEFIDDDGLLDSIRTHGVLQPVILTPAPSGEYWLRGGGERRLEASRTLGLLDIPARFTDETLSREEAEELELTENLQRSGLPWRDEVRAVVRLHELYCLRDQKWTIEATVKRIGYSQLPHALRVARDMDNPKIANATRLREAYNTLTRGDARAAADTLAEIMETGGGLLDWEEGGPQGVINSNVSQSTSPSPVEAGPNEVSGPSSVSLGQQPVHVTLDSRTPPAAEPPASLLQVSFLDWAPQYSGQKFNFLHCDFPYGIDAFSGPLSGRDRHEVYDDSPEVYWQLMRCLCENLDRILAPSAHFMFWLPADHAFQHETLEYFRTHAPSLEFWPKPLVWFKSDNVGVLADAKRKARHVYETAIVASREDRLLVKATSDCYPGPTDKQWHPSTKPEPMLRQFFGMFVDQYTSMLDPTCGGGSALRAAESLGARRVLGLEASPEHFENASKALRIFRAKRAAQELV